jgi:muconate cycloisomerase
MDKACKGNAFAKSAVEMALIDAVARTLGLPAWQLLGGKVHQSLPLAWTLASGDVSATCRKPTCAWSKSATTSSR